MPRSRSDSGPETLKQFLENYTVPNLRKLAGLVASQLPTRKAELVALILKHMDSTERLQQLWAELDSLQQAAVSEAVYSPSLTFDGARFRAKYGQAPDWGETRYGEFTRPSQLQLFIFYSRIPKDLAERLKHFVPAPRAAQVRTTDELPATVVQSGYVYDYETRTRRPYSEEIPVIQRTMEQAAQHDLLAILRLIDTGKVRASEKTRQVSSAGAKAITEVLQEGDFYPPDATPDDYATDPWPIKSFAWPLILQNAGLASLAGTKLQLTAAGRKSLTAPPYEVICRAWKRWLKTTLLDEFNRIHTIKGQTGKGKRKMTAVADRRATIVETLQTCPPHEWIAFDEFSRFMQATGHTFEVSRDLWSLYIADPHYGSLGYAGFGDWHILQGRYILAFLFEYAATLGLIDVAYIHPSGAREDYGNLWGIDDLDCLSRYDGLLYVRINSLGAWCLGLAEEYVPSPVEVPQVFKVLPNLEVVATAPLAPGDTLFLEQFAEHTSDVVWKIQPTRLLKALEEGQSIADIEAFLKARAGDKLPDNVVIFFRDVAERSSQLVDLGLARLIQAKDAALALLIVNDSRLKPLCMLAGERHIVVPAETEAAFRRAVRELGYSLPMPK